MKLLEVKNLKVHFPTSIGTTKAVEDISFTLHRGETLGIVGESGSGKSVTALSMMQLVDAIAQVSGEIIYYPKNDEPIDLLQLSAKGIRKYRGSELAMIFQEPMTSLNPVFTCGNQVLETILIHRKVSKKEAKAITLDLFQKVHLPEPNRVFQSYPHELSGGQKQRVMIAMAMSCQPDILIADEPTTALDVTVQQKILELMLDLKKEMEMSMIFISHDLGVVSKVTDKVLVMYQGKIVEQGSVNDIFKNPQHPYTKGLLACRPPLDERLSQLPTIDDFMEVVEENDRKVIKAKNVSIENITSGFKVSMNDFQKRQKQLQATSPILKVENLTTHFQKRNGWLNFSKEYVKAVDGVSFEVFEGETLGLVGESGCGKTTLGRTILRLQEAVSGNVFYKNHHLQSLDDKAMKVLRKEIQIIFQDPYSSLNPRKTIGQSILEPMEVHKIGTSDEERKQKVYDLLETVALKKEHFHRYPHEFSGGQRQRICIARALAVEPKFIICDEAVSALDVSVQAQILNLLIQLRKKYQLTYIFISHDLSVVKMISDRIMVMNNGKIEEISDAEKIYHQPQTAYTQRLINAIPKMKR